MSNSTTRKLSFRVQTIVYDALAEEARDLSPPLPVGDHILNVLSLAAINSGKMYDGDEKRLNAQMEILNFAGSAALEIVADDRFDEHLTLTVFQELMQDKDAKSIYETAIGGDAYEDGLPGKTPLNMQIGWIIKNVTGASVQKTKDGKPKRANVRNEPIQSYTLLERSPMGYPLNDEQSYE